MSKARFVAATMLCAGIFAVGAAHAQFSGPGSEGNPVAPSMKDRLKSAVGVKEDTAPKKVMVRQLQMSPVYDKDVLIKGKITKKTGANEYRFEDLTGKMQIIAADNVFPSNVNENTQLEIVGRATAQSGKAAKHFTFNVKSMKVVTK